MTDALKVPIVEQYGVIRAHLVANRWREGIAEVEAEQARIAAQRDANARIAGIATDIAPSLVPLVIVGLEDDGA